jgi:N-acetylglucosamine-6-phosphate deacetylase
LEGVHLGSGGCIRLRIDGERIAAVESLGAVSNGHRHGPWIAPGLVDLQVNGGGGNDFSGPEVTIEGVEAVVRMLWQHGVTSFLPTVVTNPVERMSKSIRCLAVAAEGRGLESASIAGIHLEGPFISPHEGPRGAHVAEHVRPPDWSQFQRWQDLAGGRIRLVTLSPEWPGACEFIERCTASGVLVAIGHTAATTEQIRSAVAAGARLSTHFGNGAHSILPRHPNYLWDQLANDELWASVIADGHHLPTPVLKVTLRAKPERVVLVSDLASMESLPPGDYHTATGRHIRMTEDGRLVLADNPTLLAGATRQLLHGIVHLAETGLTSLAGAWEMGSTRPAALLEHPAAHGLRPGAPADVVTFRWRDNDIELLSVHKRGEAVLGEGP